MGTKDRYQTKIKGKKLRKKRYIGRLRAYKFFDYAKKKTQIEVMANLKSSIRELINKQFSNAVRKLNSSQKAK
jgi:hypothetical protein